MGSNLLSGVSKAAWAVLFVVSMSLASVAGAAAQPSDLQKVHDFLARWRAEEADKLLAPMVKYRPSSKVLLYTQARVRYYQGRYEEALKILRKAAKPEELKKNSLYSSLTATLRLTVDHKQIHSPHFTISYPDGPNAILVPYAIIALEKAYARLGKLFGYYPPDRVRVQILESAMELAAMSPLTEGDIARTGTIALCKYNRVMLTSPFALVRGYRWLDTLIHEYSHLVINRVAAGVPIWLHEGLARYSEVLWRSEEPKGLSPYSETLLARGIKTDKLVPFAKMHPSMAKLKDSDTAALAYAQVYTVIEYFVKRKGQTALPQVLHEIQKGTSVPDSFAKLLGIPFAQFLLQWKGHLRTSGLREFEGINPTKKILKDVKQIAKTKKQKERERDFWFKPKKPKELGQRFLRLGQMLQQKSRWKAALIEYLKAEKHWKNSKPSLQHKIAQIYLRLKQADKAIPHLLESLKIYKNRVTTYVNLGKAYYATKQYKEARDAFEQANQINPFDPTNHFYLVRIYRQLKDNAALKRETRIYSLLRKRR